VNKTESLASVFRELPLELIAGEPDFEAVVRQHGIDFIVPYDKAYWNSKLSREHTLLVDEALQPGDELFDVMAGVGPFAVPAALQGVDVYANDLNPASVEAMQRNAWLNEVPALAARRREAEAEGVASASAPSSPLGALKKAADASSDPLNSSTSATFTATGSGGADGASRVPIYGDAVTFACAAGRSAPTATTSGASKASSPRASLAAAAAAFIAAASAVVANCGALGSAPSDDDDNAGNQTDETTVQQSSAPAAASVTSPSAVAKTTTVTADNKTPDSEQFHLFLMDGREFVRSVARDLFLLEGVKIDSAEEASASRAAAALVPDKKSAYWRINRRRVRHFVMNLPATAIEFLDAYTGTGWPAPFADHTEYRALAAVKKPITETLEQMPFTASPRVSTTVVLTSDAAASPSGAAAASSTTAVTFDPFYVVHVYCFSATSDAESARVDAMKQAARNLQLPVGGFAPDGSAQDAGAMTVMVHGVHVVRDVAPSKLMVRVSVSPSWMVRVKEVQACAAAFGCFRNPVGAV
jgi:tRNA G37 N-methylase Trm5